MANVGSSTGWRTAIMMWRRIIVLQCVQTTDPSLAESNQQTPGPEIWRPGRVGGSSTDGYARQPRKAYASTMAMPPVNQYHDIDRAMAAFMMSH